MACKGAIRSICTFIVPEPDTEQPTIDSIANYLSSIGVAKRLRPEHIEFIDEIPMTESGKVKRHQLAEELNNRLEKRAAEKAAKASALAAKHA